MVCKMALFELSFAIRCAFVFCFCGGLLPFLCPSVSLCLSVSVSPPLSLALSAFFLSLSVCVCLSSSVFFSQCSSVFLWASLCLSLLSFLSDIFFFSLSLSLSFFLLVSLSLSLSNPLLFLSVCVCLSLSFSYFCVSLSLSLSFFSRSLFSLSNFSFFLSFSLSSSSSLLPNPLLIFFLPLRLFFGEYVFGVLLQSSQGVPLSLHLQDSMVSN